MNRAAAERVLREHTEDPEFFAVAPHLTSCDQCDQRWPCDARLAAEAVLRMLPVVEAAEAERDELQVSVESFSRAQTVISANWMEMKRERDAARAALSAVRALADALLCETQGRCPLPSGYQCRTCVIRDDLRATLGSAAPAAPAEDHGRCGDLAPTFLTATEPEPCRLPHGHRGWHRGDDGSEWSPIHRPAGGSAGADQTPEHTCGAAMRRGAVGGCEGCEAESPQRDETAQDGDHRG